MPQSLVRKAHRPPGSHLVPSTEPLSQPPDRVAVDRSVGRAYLPQAELFAHPLVIRPTRETAAWGPPSLSHAARSGVSQLALTLLDLCQWPCPASVPCRSQLKAPSLHGHYPASTVLPASPPPCRPSLTLTSCRFGGCLPSCRASRVATFFLFHACRRHYPGGSQGVPASLASPSGSGLPHFSGGSAPASPVSRPARRSLAFRPACSLNRPYAAL